MSQANKLNDKNGIVENIERVINSDNNSNFVCQKQIDHTLYWKIGRFLSLSFYKSSILSFFFH